MTEPSFTALDRLDVPDLRREVDRRLRTGERARIPESQRGRRITTSILALAVFVAAAVFGLHTWNRSSDIVPAADPWAWAPEGWSGLPAPPEWRTGAAIVWTGDELLYWGGRPRGVEAPVADGFAFDPANQAWQRMPAADLPGSTAKSVWTGSMALFWDFTTQPMEHAMQGYDPVTETWLRFPSPPHDPAWGGTYAWSGSELIVFGGGPQGSPENAEGAAFDPSTGTWHTIADAPVGLNLVSSVWTGSSFVVVGSSIDNGNHPTTETSVAMRYDPHSNSWARLPNPPVSPQTAALAFVDGALLAWEAYSPSTARYLETANTWRPLDTGDLTASECYAQGATIPGVLVAWNCGTPAAWFGATATWVGLPRPLEPAAANLRYDVGTTYAAGSVVVIDQSETVSDQGVPHLGAPDAPEHLWLWRPPESLSTDRSTA